MKYDDIWSSNNEEEDKLLIDMIGKLDILTARALTILRIVSFVLKQIKLLLIKKIVVMINESD